MQTPAPTVFELIGQLRALGAPFSLDSVRPEAVMLLVAVPGERWEIEWFEDGHLEVEVFRSSGEMGDRTDLSTLFQKLSE